MAEEKVRSHENAESAVPLRTIAESAQEHFAAPIVGAKYNNEIVDLYTSTGESDNLEFLDLSSEDGLRIYRQSLVFLLTRAVFELMPCYHLLVEHSLGKSYYCRFSGYRNIAALDLLALEAKMREYISAGEPIIPRLMTKTEALDVLACSGQDETRLLLQNLPWDRIKIYTCGNFSNYSYSPLAPNTSQLGTFRLEKYTDGFLLRFPAPEHPGVVAPYPKLPKLSHVFRESIEWADILGISNLVGLVRLLAASPKENTNLIHVAEALQEKRIAYIADEIYKHRQKLRMILIAGPSSSGKTTFAQRLAIQLQVLGMHPVSISMDNYFVNRDRTPVDENGELDYEAPEAVDLELFNRQMQQLIENGEIECPVYNFKKGARDQAGKPVWVDKGSPIIIEGIHALNERITSSIPRENKYKIYISALTQISIDDHNRVPTTDARLIRRIVRDNQFRAHDALMTLQRWPSVRRGEEKHIFPFQEDADFMFNSALIYELCVLKKFAQPLLEAVGRDEKEYSDARRLLVLLEHFPEMDERHVPYNSILREFIGGSSFQE